MAAHPGQHPGQSDYNSGGMVVFMGSVIFTVLFFIYVSFFSGGADLKELKSSQVPTAAPKAEAETTTETKDKQ